jgi:hypothetical protein
MKKLVNTTIVTVWISVVAIAIYFALTLQVKPDIMDKPFRQQPQGQNTK